MKLLPLIWKNVLRKKTRTFLTLGSILLPLLAICFMGTFLHALDSPDKEGTQGMFRLVTRHRVSLATLFPRAYQQQIAGLDGVEAVTNFNFFGGKYKDGGARNTFVRFAVEPGNLLRVYDDLELLSGSTADWLSDRTGCIVGMNIAKNFGWKVGDRIVLQGDIFPIDLELTVRGIYRLPGGPSAALFFDRRYLDEKFPRFAGQVFMVWVKARDAAAVERLGPEIDALFANSAYPTRTETEKAFQTSFVAMLGNVKLLIGAIGAILVFAIVLIAANTMAMTARERITELAVLRALGFPRRAIVALVLGEGLLLGLAGGLLGLGLFVLLAPWLKAVLLATPMAFLAASMRVYPGILALGFGVAVGVGGLAGLVPAIRSARRPIADGLRQVG
ncbi:MAG: ABC transporter permease [Acidobacteria bacterium]|nr:ABC transporter permease [Acidobacteriota bacterium]